MDLSALLPTSLEWWQVLIAIVVIIAGWILSRFARAATLRLLKFAPSLTEAVATFIARFVGGAVILVGVGIALAVLGVNLQPLLALDLHLVADLDRAGGLDDDAGGEVVGDAAQHEHRDHDEHDRQREEGLQVDAEHSQGDGHREEDHCAADEFYGSHFANLGLKRIFARGLEIDSDHRYFSPCFF